MDVKHMKEAIALAKKAGGRNEVPVGAVIVKGDKVLASCYNLKERKGLATLHAEILAIQKASKKIGDWRLEDCDIYVTLEPCPMCAGALIQARVANIYFGAYDKNWGCCGSVYNLPAEKAFNHHPAVQGGILEEECGEILRSYFRAKREEKKRKE